MKTLKFLTAIIIFLSITLWAQDDQVKKEPGYFDFGELSSFDQGDEGAEVLVEEHLLKMVSKMTKSQDKELSALLDGLKLVKVNTFQINKENKSGFQDKLNSIQSALKNNKWDRIVRVRQKGEDMNVFVKTDRDHKINGLVVAGVDEDGEAVFVNIVGDIDLESIGKLSDKFDIPSLDDIKKNK